MNKNELDWYSLSKLYEFNTQQSKYFQKFHQIIKNSTLSQQNINKVPYSHRKNLLIMFQNISKSIYFFNQDESIKQNLIVQKEQINIKASSLQQQLQRSLSEIKVKKNQVLNYKKILQKQRCKLQKIKGNNKKNNKNKNNKFYCPFCERQQFQSKQIFKFHVFSQYESIKSNNNNPNFLNQHKSQIDSMKEFMVTMKQKEIELMKMILKQKKQNDMKQLQKKYEKQLKSFNDNNGQSNISDGKSLKSINNNINNQEQYYGQLAGQSQYYFFPKTTHNFSHLQQYSSQKQQQNYFNCPSLKQPISCHIPQSSSTFYHIKNQNANLKNHHNLVQKKPLHLQLNQPISSKKHIIQISSKSNFNSKSKQVFNDTIYYQSNNNISINNNLLTNKNNQNNHIFNAGILKDDSDASQSSDYQDYFANQNKIKSYINKKTQYQQQIQDQQICVDTQIMIKDISTLRKNRQIFFHSESKLQQPSSIQKKPFQDEKSQSCIVDLSQDSIHQSAKKLLIKNSLAFNQSQNSHLYSYSISIASNESEINLSDLKLSKLQRKQKKQQKNIKNYQILQKKNNSDIKQNNSLSYQQNALQRVQKMKNFSKKKKQINQPQKSILSQFAKVSQIQHNSNNKKNNQLHNINPSILSINYEKKNIYQKTNKYNKQSNKNILSEFFKEENNQFKQRDHQIYQREKQRQLKSIDKIQYLKDMMI